MDKRSGEPEVIRGVGLDVPTSLFKERLKELGSFLEEFDAKQITNREGLLETFDDHASQLTTIIRAVGNIERFPDPDKVEDIPKEKGEWVSFTPVIKTDRLIAKWFRDTGFVRILIAGPKGFGESEKPKGGFSLIVPDGSGKDEWLALSNQFVMYAENGSMIYSMDFEDEDDATMIDLQNFAGRYKQALELVVDYAKKHEIN